MPEVQVVQQVQVPVLLFTAAVPDPLTVAPAEAQAAVRRVLEALEEMVPALPAEQQERHQPHYWLVQSEDQAESLPPDLMDLFPAVAAAGKE